jgi:hypothetical protein
VCLFIFNYSLLHRRRSRRCVRYHVESLRGCEFLCAFALSSSGPTESRKHRLGPSSQWITPYNMCGWINLGVRETRRRSRKGKSRIMAVAAGTKLRSLCLLGPPPVSWYYIRMTVMIIHGPRYCCLAPGLLLQSPNTYTSKTHRSESHQQPSSETTDLVSLPATLYAGQCWHLRTSFNLVCSYVPN